jgi:hypothetical protein
LDPAAEIIGLKSGITSAEIRPTTGSLLIAYDADQIDEAQILTWLETLAADFINLGAASELRDEANLLHRFSQLRNRLSRESVL